MRRAVIKFGLLVGIFVVFVAVDSFLGLVAFALYQEPLSIITRDFWASVFLGVALYGWFSFLVRLLIEPWLGLPVLFLIFKIKTNKIKSVMLLLSIARVFFLALNTFIFSFWHDFKLYLEIEEGVINPLVYSIVLASFISPWIVYFLGGKRIYIFLWSR